jgi:AcrR family transcriptional regulator
MARATESTDDAPPGPGRRTGLDRDDVIDAALDLVEAEGPSALTMRRLAVKLGMGTPTIYWHVGSRDGLVAEVIRAQSRRLAELEVVGDSPRDRVFSAARNIWESSIEHRAFTSLAHQTGTSNLLTHPLGEALVVEIEQAGLTGEAATGAAWEIFTVVAGSLLLALRNPSSVPQEYRPGALWASSDAPIDADTRAAMQADPDFDAVCASTLRAVIDARIPAQHDRPIHDRPIHDRPIHDGGTSP